MATIPFDVQLIGDERLRLRKQEQDEAMESAVECELMDLVERVMLEEAADSDEWQTVCEALGGDEPEAKRARQLLRDLIRADRIDQAYHLAQALYHAMYDLASECFEDVVRDELREQARLAAEDGPELGGWPPEAA